MITLSSERGEIYQQWVQPIEKDGSLTCVKIIRGVSNEIDREIKRVVRAMPSWIPSEENGRNERTKFRIPISYRLN